MHTTTTSLVMALVAVCACAWLATGAEATKSKQPVSCLDDTGAPVDWYIVYKFPKLSSKESPFDTGFAYAYMTSKTVSSEAKGAKANWVVSDNLITDAKSMILRTLAAAYEDKSFHELTSVMYSDQPPTLDRALSNRAHAKGVLMTDRASGNGVLLSHSVPNFPPPRSERLEFQETTKKFGQTFMCISFDFAESGAAIVDHLVNMRPYVYDSYIHDEVVETAPAFDYLVVDAKMPPRRKSEAESSHLVQTITTRGGQPLELFSKSGQIKEDMYSGWLDDELDSDLYVLTWRRGVGLLDSTCPPNDYHVNNVEEMRIKVGKNTNVWWTNTNDHSKWAISGDADVAKVCLGDMNRAESQFARGGGAICMQCPACWKIFSSSIGELEPCPVRTHGADSS